MTRIPPVRFGKLAGSSHDQEKVLEESNHQDCCPIACAVPVGYLAWSVSFSLREAAGKAARSSATVLSFRRLSCCCMATSLGVGGGRAESTSLLVRMQTSAKCFSLGHAVTS